MSFMGVEASVDLIKELEKAKKSLDEETRINIYLAIYHDIRDDPEIIERAARKRAKFLLLDQVFRVTDLDDLVSEMKMEKVNEQLYTD